MQIFNVEWKWNIPNIISLVRIGLVPVFILLYLLHLDAWAFGVLLFSGLTDCLDGFIARRFNLITDCGKLLDPLSDKLTQVAVVICLTTRYTELLPLTVLCFAKELSQGIGGILLLRKNVRTQGAKWFGKVSTVLFYACMLVIVLWYNPLVQSAPWVLYALAGLVGISMLIAFLGYLRLFLQMRRELRVKVAPVAEIAPEPEKG